MNCAERVVVGLPRLLAPSSALQHRAEGGPAAAGVLVWTCSCSWPGHVPQSLRWVPPDGTTGVLQRVFLLVAGGCAGGAGGISLVHVTEAGRIAAAQRGTWLPRAPGLPSHGFSGTGEVSTSRSALRVSIPPPFCGAAAGGGLPRC